MMCKFSVSFARLCVALQVSSDDLSANVMGLHEAGCTRSGKALSDDSDQHMKRELESVCDCVGQSHAFEVGDL